MILQHVAAIFLPACLAMAALSDLLTMTIPNRLTLALAVAFPVAALAIGLPPAAAAWHVAAGAVVLAGGFGMFAAGWIGGGDAKLAAAAALWIGMETLMPWLLVTALFGGALTIGLLLVRQLPLPMALARHDWAMRLHAPQTGIPYGIALAAGGLWVFHLTPWAAPLGL